MTYADTSFLASLYLNDANTPQAVELAQSGTAPYALTPFIRLELANAVRLANFRKMITAKQERDIFRNIEQDRGTGFLAETPIAWSEILDQAEEVSAKYTPKIGVRTLDLLHAAAAIILASGTFLTFDTRQRTLAERIGLKVQP